MVYDVLVMSILEVMHVQPEYFKVPNRSHILPQADWVERGRSFSSVK
jgi:hypothetical protein